MIPPTPNAPVDAGGVKVVVPLAMTTQFAPPTDTDCAVWALTTDDMDGDDFIYSNTADERFTACQPSGWADRPDARRFTFSPAVCPSGWSWHHIGIAPNNISTTALCCAAGFTPYLEYNMNLGRTVKSRALGFEYGATSTTTVVTLASGSVSSVSSVFFVHEAWNIAWREGERDTLTPKPPSLADCTTKIYFWDGKATSFCGSDDSTNGSGGDDDLAGLGQMAMGLIPCLTLLVAIVLACIGFCVWSNRRDRKKRRHATQATQGNTE